MDEPVRVACAQVEPVVFDRAATLDKLAVVAAEAAAQGAQLVLFPETFVPVYPSSRWARALAARASGKETVGAARARVRHGAERRHRPRSARSRSEHGLVLAVGVNELDGGTLYNALLVFAPDGELACATAS